MSETISAGLTITIPTLGEQNWDQTIKNNCFTPISSHDHTGGGNGVQIGTAALQNDAVTDVKIRLTNDGWLTARNAANTADVNIIKIDTNNQTQLANRVGIGRTPSAGYQLDIEDATDTRIGLVLAGSRIGIIQTASNSLNIVTPNPSGAPISLQTNGGEKLRVYAATSQIGIVDGTGAAPSLTFINDTDTGIFRRATDQVAFTTGGTERWYVDSAGRLTSSNSAGNSYILPSNGAAATPSHSFASDTNTGLFGTGSDVLGFATAGVERARIDSAGQMQVNGGATSLPSSSDSTVAVASGGYATTGNISNAIYGSTRGVLLLGGNYTAGVSDVAGIKFLYGPRSTTSENTAAIASVVANNTDTTANSGGSVLISTRPASGTLTERMRITADGLTQINRAIELGNTITDYPVSTAPQIYSTGNGTGIFADYGNLVLQPRSSGALRNIIFANGNPATERMRIDSAGNVGIGTTNPAHKLDVVSPAGTGTSVRIDGDASVGSTALRLSDRGTERLAVFASTSNAFVNANANANSLILWAQKAGGSILGVTGTSQTERFRITDGADVVFGNGDTSATPANATIRGTNASGTDIGGPNLTIQAGRGTGSASGGNILLQTAPTGTTGSTLNAAVTRMVVHTNGTVFLGPSSVSATPTTGTISSAGGSGTDIAGSGLDIRAGAGTGTGAGGSINLYTASAGGVSGSALNSQTARVTLKPTGQTRFVPLAADPSGAETGDIYFNSSTNMLRAYNGTSWMELDPTPTGSISAYAGAAAPSGWLLCDGTAVSRTTYATLFGVISTLYGAGDGATTFNLPNLKGRFPIGLDSTVTTPTNISARGNSGGSLNHTHSVPAHYHGLGTGATLATTTGGAHRHTIPNRSGNANVGSAGVTYVLRGGDTAQGGSTGNTLAGDDEGSHAHSMTGTIGLVTGGVDGNAAMTSGTNNPPFLVVNYIIRT